MKLRSKDRSPALQHRLIWQCAATLLTYPDRQDDIDELLDRIDGGAAALLAGTAAARRATDSLHAQAEYVETFDMRRNCTMYLTYWTAGDTRNRGAAMLAFVNAYRAAGVSPPKGETPDFLPVLLEFAATVDPHAGRRLLVEHRVAIDILGQALADAGSPYAHTVAAVANTLPHATERDLLRAQQLAASGPMVEAVGLQPFTLTVPPRRAQGAG